MIKKLKPLENKESPEWKNLSEKYNEVEKQRSNNPWLDISNQYQETSLELKSINREIENATNVIEGAKKTAKEYEDSIKKLDNLTKEEKATRDKQRNALMAENKELKESIKELEAYKKELKDKQSDARKGLNNSDNYKAVYDVIRSNLVPLADRIFANGEKQIAYDKIEHSAERVADSAESKKNQDILSAVSQDLKTGFNTDVNSDKIASLLEQIRDSLQSIGGKGGKRTGKSLSQNEIKEAYNIIQKAFEPIQKALPSADRLALPSGKKLDRSTVMTSVMDPSKSSKLKSAFNKLFGGVAENYETIMAKTSEEQDKMNAERIKKYGINSNRFPAETGDKSRIYRSLALWRGRDKFSSMFQDFQTTPGVKINTTEITKAVAEALSGAEMFKAQTGGWFNNLMAAGTGGLAFLFQPSLEKSRAQADAVNTIMADIRENMNAVLQDILNKESALSAMREQGDIQFNEDGSVAYGTPEAKMLAVQLEESKLVLQSLLADVGMVDEVVANTGGKLSEIVKQLGFTAPLLRKDNAILANINAGLDKSGKAFKFQRRSQEIMNYAFQLMGRHIGQIFKRLMLMLNPINLIKKAFSDFASYDVKWQRTMNVIKYNIRRIIRPFMEWLAQQLVNLIGLGNALVKGIGKVFGYNWDLFDQTAANTEKMHEEMEAAANVTAGFDELHDIGSDNSAAGDLMGDIYTPQWEGLNEFFENIGTAIGNIVDTISKFTFWDWLAIGGTALAGFLILRTLINWFTKGKNPLQSVADGLSFLEKAVGWSILILSFTLFTKALTDFVDCMKSASWEDIAKSLITLAGAFGILVGAMVLLGKFATADWTAFLGMAAVIAVLDGLVLALTPFLEVIKDMTTEQLMSGLIFLAGALTAVALAVGVLATVFTAIATTGVGLAALGILAGILGIIALVILALAEFARAVGTYSDEIIAVMRTAGEVIVSVITTIGNTIERIIESIAMAIITVLQPIMDFIDSIIGKVIELAKTIAHEIGETIRTIVKTIGDIVLGIIRELVNAIPNLLNAILNFCGQIGPAIENSVNAILRAVTRLINFVVSGIEYLVNTLLIGSINKAVSTVTFGTVNNLINTISIPRFVPQYEQGTNYVPNNGLAYLHQGEAVIPKKYNQPYNQGMSNEERAYMQQMMATMKSLDGTMKQGIVVNGQFVQRGSDLVAVVNKTKSQTGSDLLSNVAYAR